MRYSCDGKKVMCKTLNDGHQNMLQDKMWSILMIKHDAEWGHCVIIISHDLWLSKFLLMSFHKFKSCDCIRNAGTVSESNRLCQYWSKHHFLFHGSTNKQLSSLGWPDRFWRQLLPAPCFAAIIVSCFSTNACYHLPTASLEFSSDDYVSTSGFHRKIV